MSQSSHEWQWKFNARIWAVLATLKNNIAVKACLNQAKLVCSSSTLVRQVC